MAPPRAFSYFRTHRRTGSTPSSPQPNQWPESSPSHKLDSAAEPTFDHSPHFSPPHLESSISSLPPVLPPIPRVASRHEPARRPTRKPVPERPKDPHPQRQPQRQDYEPPQSINHTPPTLPPIPRVASQQGKQSEPGTQSADPGQGRFQHTNRKGSWNIPSDITQLPQNTPVNRVKNHASVPDLGQAMRKSQPAGLGLGNPPNMLRPITPQQSRKQSLEPTSMNLTTHRSDSPSSSVSSFHKTASSTNLAIESSPASSRSAHGSSTQQTTAHANNTTSNSNSTTKLARARMSLLNPVSLLKRRRTSQPTDIIPDPPLSSRDMDVPAMKLPENYDPRIKGKGIHDFSSPRPKRNYSTNDMAGMEEGSKSGGLAPSQGSLRRSSIPTSSLEKAEAEKRHSSERDHVPVFVENFETDEDSERGASAIQRESLANPAFLARMSRQLDFDALDFSMPAAQPKQPAEPHSNENKPARSSKNTDDSSYRMSSDQSTMRSSMSNETKATSPPSSPNRNLSRASAALETPFQPTTNLNHLSSKASDASRFSFQLNSDRSIEQEKALEDKHKQKNAKASKHASVADSRFEELEEEDMYDYDDMDDGGLEEQIPGVNMEMDDDDTRNFKNPRFSLSTPIHSAPAAATCPQDESIQTPQRSPSPQYDQQESIEPDKTKRESNDTLQRAMTALSTTTDDMYYDDGMIDQLPTEDHEYFDEDALNSPEQASFKQPSLDRSPPQRQNENHWQNLPKISTTDLDRLPRQEPVEQTHHVTESTVDHEESLSQGQSGGLQAYHSALASAASRAARDGKFERTRSVLTAASSRYSEDTDVGSFVPTDDGQDDGDLDDFADDIAGEDDPMVAEANAEVLASEDSEYYGQEFGFYRAPTSKDAEGFSGGFFGQPQPPGWNATREPNLTPITERSEYSTRNSFISMAGYGPGYASSTTSLKDNPFSSPIFSTGYPGSASRDKDNNLTSPNLKELAASHGLDDEDLTLSQLMKLRKDTFGGSSASAGSGQASHRSSVANNSSPGGGGSPSSLTIPSPLNARSFQPAPSAFSINPDRRPSNEAGPAAPPIAEQPEREAEEASACGESPVLPPTPPTVTRSSRHHRRSSSANTAEAYAQEYAECVSNPPSPFTTPKADRYTFSSSSPNAPRTADTWSPSLPPNQSHYSYDLPRSPSPIAEGSSGVEDSSHIPSSQRQPSSPSPSPRPGALSSFNDRSSPLAAAAAAAASSSSSSSPPMPSTEMMNKFKDRPAPDGYRRSSQVPSSPPLGSPSLPSQTSLSKQGGAGNGSGENTSVAYVREVDDETGERRWFLERRRKVDGELVVVGREVVEGGI